MKVLILSDIHANLTALDAVLADVQDYDAVWCLGDLVGYGPDPNECVERIRGLPNLVCLMGNHDAAVLDIIDANAFNPEARASVQWTKQTLTEANLLDLGKKTARIVVEDTTLAHASPRYPIWEYLLDVYTAKINFDYFTTALCLVGHTHVPVIYSLEEGASQARLVVPEANTVVELPTRSIVNPGSVGQPRDRDPRAAYALFEPETYLWEYRRVPYEVEPVQARMRAAGLPERHIKRLAAGW